MPYANSLNIMVACFTIKAPPPWINVLSAECSERQITFLASKPLTQPCVLYFLLTSFVNVFNAGIEFSNFSLNPFPSERETSHMSASFWFPAP